MTVPSQFYGDIRVHAELDGVVSERRRVVAVDEPSAGVEVAGPQHVRRVEQANCVAEPRDRAPLSVLEPGDDESDQSLLRTEPTIDKVRECLRYLLH